MYLITKSQVVSLQFVYLALSNYIIPSMQQVSKAEYTSKLMVSQATAQIVANPGFLGMVWVKDNTQYSITKNHALKESKVVQS